MHRLKQQIGLQKLGHPENLNAAGTPGMALDLRDMSRVVARAF